MTVASGQQVYEYTTAFGDIFNWRVPAGGVPPFQPSGILFEEIMYALKAEYLRVACETSGYTNRGRGRSDDIKFTPQHGALFIKWLNQGRTGLFDPSPTGGHLEGTLGHASGLNADRFSPGQLNARYLKDMKDVFRAVVSQMSAHCSATPQEIMQSWLQKYKKYNDSFAQSGFFYKEFADWSYSNTVTEEDSASKFSNLFGGDQWTTDEYEDVFRQELLHSGVWLSTRHLDELRIQPIPMISHSSGTIVPTAGNSGSYSSWLQHKRGSTHSPIRPRYCRTDGTLNTNYGTKCSIFGNVLISGMDVFMSGNGKVYKQGTYTAAPDGFNPHLPLSGTFTPVSMDSGVYTTIIGLDHSTAGIGNASGLFPWGTGINGDLPQHAYTPRVDHPIDFANYNDFGDTDLLASSERLDVPGRYGYAGFYVVDELFCSQDNYSNNGAYRLSLSGVYLMAPHPNALEGAAGQVVFLDFYDASGTGDPLTTHRHWGHEFRQIPVGGGDYWGAKGFCLKRGTPDKIIRACTSGTSSSLIGNGFSKGNECGWILEWELPLKNPTYNSITSGNITTNSIVWSHRLSNIRCVTYNGTNYICQGIVSRASGASSTTLGTFGGSNHSFWVDGSYNISNVAWTTGSTGDSPSGGGGFGNQTLMPMAYTYIHTDDVVLGAIQPQYHGIGGAYSGLYAKVSWDFTSPYTAMSGRELRDWQTPVWGDGDVSEGLCTQYMDVGNGSTNPRITHFFQNPVTDQVYAFILARPSGSSSSSYQRWIVEVDTSTDPYEFNRCHWLSFETSALNMVSNQANQSWVNYCIMVEY